MKAVELPLDFEVKEEPCMPSFIFRCFAIASFVGAAMSIGRAADTLPASAPSANPATMPAHRFEKDVETYEAADKAEMPPKNAILLAGDSQFFRWKTLKE